MPTQAQLILRNDNGVVIDLLDGTRYEYVDGTYRISPLHLLPGHDGRSAADYENRTISLGLKLLSSDATYDLLAVNLQRLAELRFEARQYETFRWGPKVELQERWGQTTSAAASTSTRLTEPIYWDVIDWTDDLPANAWGLANLRAGPALGTTSDTYRLTLTVRPFARGHEEEFENYLLNPSFERGAAPGENWTTIGGATNTLDRTHKYHGLQSVKIVGVSSADGLGQNVTLTANRAYIAAAWVYRIAGTLVMQVVDATNSVVYVEYSDAIVANQWVHISVEFVTNSVTAWNLRFVQSGGTALTAWADCAMISPYEPFFDLDTRGLWHMESAANCTPKHGLPGGAQGTYDMTQVGIASATTTGAARRQGLNLNGSNQWSWLNLQFTHIFEDDGGVFSTNRASTAAFKIHDLNVNDAGYFGDTRGTFNQIALHIGTARVGGTDAWEYYNGAWVALTVTDDTTTFSVTGRNIVTFTAPADWTTVAVNGVTAYWVRARVTALVTTAPQNATTEVNRSGIFEDLTGSFTMTCFFNSDVMNATTRTLFSKRNTGGTRAESLHFFLDSDDLLQFSYWDSAGTGHITESAEDLIAATWYFAAFVHDTAADRDRLWLAELNTRTKVRLVADVTARITDMRPSCGVFMVAANDQNGDPDSSAGNFFDGIIDEISIHGAALTESQLNRILSSGLQKYRTLNGGSEMPKAWVGARELYEREDTETQITNRFDFRDIPGDIPARADYFAIRGSGYPTIGTIVAGLRTFQPLLFDMFQGESDADATGEGVTSATNASSLTGAYKRVSLASSSGMVDRIGWNLPIANSTFNDAGELEAFIRVIPGTSGSPNARIVLSDYLATTTGKLFVGETFALTSNATAQLYSLGQIPWPPVPRDEYDIGHGTTGLYRVWLQLGATSTTPTVDVDFLMLLPVQEDALAARIYRNGGAQVGLLANRALHLSGIQQKAWARYHPNPANATNPLDIAGEAGIDLSGSIPSLPPDDDGAIFWSFYGGGTSDFGNFSISSSTGQFTAMRTRYQPLYSQARGD